MLTQNFKKVVIEELSKKDWFFISLYFAHHTWSLQRGSGAAGSTTSGELWEQEDSKKVSLRSPDEAPTRPTPSQTPKGSEVRIMLGFKAPQGP